MAMVVNEDTSYGRQETPLTDIWTRNLADTVRNQPDCLLAELRTLADRNLSRPEHLSVCDAAVYEDIIRTRRSIWTADENPQDPSQSSTRNVADWKHGIVDRHAGQSDDVRRSPRKITVRRSSVHG